MDERCGERLAGRPVELVLGEVERGEHAALLDALFERNGDALARRRRQAAAREAEGLEAGVGRDETRDSRARVHVRRLDTPLLGRDLILGRLRRRGGVSE